MESDERQQFRSAVTRHRFSVWSRSRAIAKQAARQVTQEKSADKSAHSKGIATVPIATIGVPPMASVAEHSEKTPTVSRTEAGPRDADQSARDARDLQNEFKTSSTSRRKQAILLFCILIFCYSFVHQRMGWNQNSRLDLLHALFVQKTFKIDAYHENTGDKSIANGHYYSDKAPGIVFLALPAFAIAEGILHVLDVPLDSEKGWLASSWITTVGSVGLITALGGAFIFLFFCRLVEQRIAFLTTYVVFLGSAPFPYATMLFSHAAVIGLICIALWSIADDEFLKRMINKVGGKHSASPVAIGGTNSVSPNPSWLRRHVLAGLCCGLAISSEYTAAVVAGGVLALALLTSFKRGMILSLAAIPPLLLIPAYNSICFGGPLAFGYHNLALPEFQEMNKGLFGITFPPKLSAVYLILFSPERGLFFWTPFFLTAFPGLVALFRASPKLALTVAIVFLLQVLCISGYYMPNGGAALGPRHLSPALPLLTILAAVGMSKHLRTGITLGYYSTVVTSAAIGIDAMPPLDVFMCYYHRFASGTFAYNLLTPSFGVYFAFNFLITFVLVVYGVLLFKFQVIGRKFISMAEA